MKKSIILFIAGILSISSTLFAQPQCSQNVWLELDRKQIAKAVKSADECVAQNPTSPDAWLMRANAYLQRHNDETEKLEKDSKYIVKAPDAIIIANESFIKAQELNPKIEARIGMIDPKKGRGLCVPPLYNRALEAFKAEDYEKARNLFNATIKNLSVEENLSYELKYNLGIFYTQLAETYTALKDSVNAKQSIINGVKTNTPYPNIYLQLYDIYKNEGDTVNAFKTIQAAKRNVKDSLALDIYVNELDYYGTMNNLEKMNKTRDLIFEKYGKTVKTIFIVVAYLNNSNQWKSAEELILQGLEIDPLNFDLNKQMALRYYLEGLQYQKEATEASSKQLITLSAKRKEAYENAHDWAEKAYQINNNDMGNNKMLHLLKMFLGKDIPEELQQKIDSYK